MIIYKVDDTYYAFKSCAIKHCNTIDSDLIIKMRKELNPQKAEKQVKRLQKFPTRKWFIEEIKLDSTKKSDIVYLLNNAVQNFLQREEDLKGLEQDT